MAHDNHSDITPLPAAPTATPPMRRSVTGGFSNIVAEPPFGPYIVKRRIAISGLGELYQAHNSVSIQDGILKRLRADRAGSMLARRRFEVEINLGRELKHPNIVNVLDAGTIDDRCFLFMEEIRGPSLRQILSGAAPWQISQQGLLLALEQLARAIGWIHQRGVVHCDLKPENILFRSATEPVLIDFGLAQWTGGSARVPAGEDQQATGYILGTPTYMSPETITGRLAQATPAADVYAFGVILYEILAGRPPFVQPDSDSRQAAVMALIEQVVEAAPQPIRRIRPEVEEAWDTLCMQCLAKKPGQRPQSFEAVARDVGAIARTGKAMPVTQTGVFRRVTQWLTKPGP